MTFCTRCGHAAEMRVPPRDDRERAVCPQCHHIHYVNPKLVVGCVAEWQDRILLCRRAIEPRSGKWTVPAGYLEVGETVAEGVRREVWEEAGARIDALTPYVLLNLTFVSQVYVMFRGHLVHGTFEAGEETLEAGLFLEREVPWAHLAFTSVEKTLRFYFADRATGEFSFHMGDVSR